MTESGSTRFVRLDEPYLLRVRPFLTDGEARVYEAAMLMCDGWQRPTNCAALAEITRLHSDSVRKAIRSLELLQLIRTRWSGSPTSPHAQRIIEIVRDYAPVEVALAALGRAKPSELMASPPEADLDVASAPHSGRYEPELDPTPGATSRSLRALRAGPLIS